MKLSRILESEDIKRNIIICDRSHNEIQVNGIDEALTLPAELMDRRVVRYECSDNETYPIRITMAESMAGIHKYRPEYHKKRERTTKNEKRR